MQAWCEKCSIFEYKTETSVRLLQNIFMMKDSIVVHECITQTLYTSLQGLQFSFPTETWLGVPLEKFAFVLWFHACLYLFHDFFTFLGVALRHIDIRLKQITPLTLTPFTEERKLTVLCWHVNLRKNEQTLRQNCLLKIMSIRKLAVSNLAINVDNTAGNN